MILGSILILETSLGLGVLWCVIRCFNMYFAHVEWKWVN